MNIFSAELDEMRGEIAREGGDHGLRRDQHDQTSRIWNRVRPLPFDGDLQLVAKRWTPRAKTLWSPRGRSERASASSVRSGYAVNAFQRRILLAEGG
ncbi:hypothetical protein K523DRAFT_134777 [Schizophyllum commune Tattone D]|nr:hypothetical protein K523DRAFT_134777 [Schizophyllum commune Tattone D]